MRVLVAGASSRLGRLVCARLADAGHAVTPLSRASGVDLTRPETLRGRCDGHDAVVSLVGASLTMRWQVPEQTFDRVDRDGNLALLDEAVRAGVPRFVYLSVYGDWPPDVRYVEAHRAVDAALHAAPLGATSIRPTGFFGAFEVLLAIVRWGVAFRVGDGESRTNPIHEADLADVIAARVPGGPPVVEVGGPEVLTRNQITDLLFAATGRTPRVIGVPKGLLLTQSRLVGALNPRLGDLIRFVAEVSTHDAVAPPYGSRRLAESIGRA